MFEIISKLIDNQFPKSAFKSGFFEKNDLISDLYLLISEIEEELSEKEILNLIKKKYFQYFDIYDIKDNKSYDKFETGIQQVQKDSKEIIVNKEDNEVYDFFEKIIWKDGAICPKCKSKEAYPSQKNSRYYDCRNCGCTFSFSQNSNLRMAHLPILRNIMTVYNLLIKGTICLRKIQEETGLSKEEVKNSYYKALPNIIHGEDLVKPLKKIQLKKEDEKIVAFSEYSHQTETISNALEYYKTNSRGKIIHPCGSGKTYTSIRIAQELQPHRLLVVIPSRLLLKQQIERFSTYFEDYDFYAFGSLTSYEKDFKKSNVKVLGDSVLKQRQQIKLIDKYKKTVIFITLQSFCKMEQDFPENFFDFAIFDEAHRVAGEEYKSFLKVVDFKCYQKALFLTATEKNYNEDGAVGMNSSLFGEIISKIYMKEMVDKGIICDYNVVNVGFKDDGAITLLDEHKEFFIDVKIKLPVKKRILMSALSLAKCIEKYDIKKVITYHSNVEESIIFINVFNLLCNKYNIDFGCYNIHSKMGRTNFSNNINNFINDKKAVISSVNCFQEGIDIIEVDAVLYGYDKRSKIDIPQSVGRCIRKSPNKEKGYVIIPEIEGKFNKLIKVLNALEAVDPRISEFKRKEKTDKEYKNLFFEPYTTSASEIFNFDYFYNNLDVYFRGKEFLSYVEASKYIRENTNIKTCIEYFKWTKSKDFPKFLYKTPKYENFSWGEYLTGEKREDFVNINDFRKFLKDNGIRTYKKFVEFSKKDDFPKNIPVNFKWVYGLRWAEILDKKIKKVNKEFISYEDAKKWCKHNNLKTISDFQNRIFNSEHPIPTNPNSFYKNEWKGWDDFLGVDNLLKRCEYEDAKKLLLKFPNIKKSTSYKEWAYKGKDFPSGILPKNPKAYYENKKSWISWDDFFSRNTFASFHEFKSWIKNKNIRSVREYIKTINIDNSIKLPKDPSSFYKEWTSWVDVLDKSFMGYEDTKKWLIDNGITPTIDSYVKWIKYKRKQDYFSLPFNFRIPVHPQHVYKDEWKGWDDFLNRK